MSTHILYIWTVHVFRYISTFPIRSKHIMIKQVVDVWLSIDVCLAVYGFKMFLTLEMLRFDKWFILDKV